MLVAYSKHLKILSVIKEVSSEYDKNLTQMLVDKACLFKTKKNMTGGARISNSDIDNRNTSKRIGIKCPTVSTRFKNCLNFRITMKDPLLMFQHSIVNSNSKTERCAFPKCPRNYLKVQWKPITRCFACNVPLCIDDPEKNNNTCFFNYHTQEVLENGD